MRGFCSKHRCYFLGEECPQCPPLPPSECIDPTPACPWCKTNRDVYEEGFKHFWCSGCKRSFDPTEDGDVGYGSPSKRMERQERAAERKGK